jgi:serine protease
MKKFITLLCLISFTVFGQDYVPNQLLVQLKTNTLEHSFFRQFEATHQIEFKSTSCISIPMNVYVLTFNESENIEDILKLLKSEHKVTAVQFNHYVQERETIPNDPLFTANQWHLKNTGQTGGTVDADIDATEAWDISTGGTTTHDDTIVVCILEGSGVDIYHEDIAGNVWHNYAEIPANGIDDDNNGYIDDVDGWNIVAQDDAVGTGSHGTRVAGMIGAVGNNSIGISGVNHNVKMMVVKGQNASDEASVIAAYTYPLTMRKIYNQSNGQAGAFVVATNASWGVNGGDPANSPLWCALYDTLGHAGIINIGATSNSNVNVDVIGDLPTTCPSDYLIGVTMTNSADVRAGSGYGPIHIDLAAPGSNVYLSKPGNIYGTTSGTSFATPCVTGSVALLYATPCADFINFTKAYPDSAALKVKSLILNNVDAITNLSTEVLSGGRLNINNSMLDLLNSCNTNSCVAPYNLSFSNLTDTVVDIEWEGFSFDYSVFLQEGTQPMVEIMASGVNTLHFDTLTPCTNYKLYVKAECGPQVSDLSYPIEFKTDGCCDNPELTATSTETSLTIDWINVLYASDYTLRYRELGTTPWIEELNATSGIELTPLETCTDYEFQIKTTCTDSTHGYSLTQIFKTKGCGSCYDLTYCGVSGTNSNTEWIDTVKIGSFTSATGNNNGWYTSTDVTFSFLPNSTQNITIIPGYSGTQYTEKYSVWIDFDQNGVFDPTDKAINLLTNNGTVVGLMNIPTSAAHGITKMRIGMISSTSDTPAACPTATVYGEYEDYCVYIGPEAGISESELDFRIYPNPVTSYLQFESSVDIASLTIQSVDGKMIRTIQNPNTQIDVIDLPNGIYLIQIKTESATKTLKFVKQ